MTVVQRGGHPWLFQFLLFKYGHPHRRSNYDVAEITVRLLNGKNASKDAVTQENKSHKSEENGQHPQMAYGSNRTFGTRQSKRIRESKDGVEKKRITVSKSTTVKDIKVMVSACLVCWSSLDFRHSYMKRSRSRQSVNDCPTVARNLTIIRLLSQLLDFSSTMSSIFGKRQKMTRMQRQMISLVQRKGAKKSEVLVVPCWLRRIQTPFQMLL